MNGTTGYNLMRIIVQSREMSNVCHGWIMGMFIFFLVCERKSME